jgi:hypothetical protein
MFVYPPLPKRTADTPQVTWQSQLSLACETAEVISIAKDFLASFTPYEIASLPEPCRPPPRLVDADDVNSYAVDLVRHICDEAGVSAEIIHRLAAFFADAAARISRLMGDRRRDIAARGLA